MAKYCCFFCPAKGVAGSALDEQCPTCGRTYGFPLEHRPNDMDGHEVTKSLGRGFYAATYVCETGKLKTQYVLKVAPTGVYRLFAKDFERECHEHKRIAEGTEHVVKIDDMFEAMVEFGGVSVPCHVARLQFIDGEPLDRLLTIPDALTARTIAQIAIDLFEILDEFSGRAFHNDLHGGNIMIQKGLRRADAIDPSIRAVAVDLGSLSDLSRSDSDEKRLGDIHWVARHLLAFVDHLLRDPDSESDLDYRLASALEDIAHRLAPSAEMQKVPGMVELADQIRGACRHVASPWREPLNLKKFNDSYNAQTLAPWYVPLLLVDPEERWLSRMSTRGPQIITGMRGCGKTLFLRALQFHARAAPRDAEPNGAVLDRLRNDHFFGLYVSTNRLLDTLGEVSETLHEPYARLYVAYALEAVRALDHLQEIDRTCVEPAYPRILGRAIGDFLRGITEDISEATLAQQLHHRLLRALVSLSRGESTYTLHANPAVAFPHLAEAVQKCSPIFTASYVLFLLDDVSTRYLDEPKIRELLSALLFQSPLCAFKITSEAQTLELALRSPGQIEVARAGRDYEVFDLGAEVYNRITKRQPAGSADGVHGKAFVEQILQRRAAYYSGHPRGISPKALLGDTSLESIALEIARSESTSRRKKEIYWGLTALARVCVGDIGDVISLYELILQKAEGTKWPISPAIQSESYQQFCSRRLYDLNRRKGELKDIALSFAEASHDLLLKSDEDNRHHATARDRLRQYMSIYVRITTGDTQWQYGRLRELIDSGVFVFAGGSDTPRTKTRDSNPTQQFKLTFRKIYGLSNFIGLAEGDRFELSGQQLEEWLRDPARGKEILLRNLGGRGEFSGVEAEPDAAPDDQPTIPARAKLAVQKELFESTETIGPLFPPKEDDLDPKTTNWLDQYVPSVRPLSLADLRNTPIDILVLGLGFEARASESAKRICASIKPKKAYLIRYPEAGRADAILRMVKQTGAAIEILDHDKIEAFGFPDSARIMIDISGLVKPILFEGVRQAIKASNRAFICHTMARQYYPLETDIGKVLRAEKSRDHYALLTLLSRVLTGEAGPYEIQRLHSSEVDATRRRALFAFASPKHERLLTLLENREYDQLEIVAPATDSQRGKLARIAADVAARNFGNGRVTEIGSNDLSSILTFMMQRHHHWYVGKGFNCDLALTGSKIQGVACAVLSSVVRIANCIYVSPREFDTGRFTKGVSRTSIFEIAVRS